MNDKVRVVVVGPCVSGKTTLVEKLCRLGYAAQSVAQEHAGVPTLWRHAGPDVLVYLDCSLQAIRRRRAVPWGAERLRLQHRRLADARRHANLYVVTDHFCPDRLARAVHRFIQGFQRHRQFVTGMHRTNSPRKGA